MNLDWQGTLQGILITGIRSLTITLFYELLAKVTKFNY